jgi:hypothetical protein
MPKARYSRDSKPRKKERVVATSKMNAKQRLSRMGKKVRKGELSGALHEL